MKKVRAAGGMEAITLKGGVIGVMSVRAATTLEGSVIGDRVSCAPRPGPEGFRGNRGRGAAGRDRKVGMTLL